MRRLIGLILFMAISAVVVFAGPNQPNGFQDVDLTIKSAEDISQFGDINKDDDTGPTESDSSGKEKPKENDVELAKAQLKGEFYKETTGSLKWALGIMVTFFVVFLAYLIVRREKEYKEALKEVKEALKESREASKEARSHADSAKEWEEKAQRKFEEIDESVNKKLEAIDEKGKKIIADTNEEAERQRNISELWNKGLAARKGEDFELAAESFERIVKDYKEESAWAYNNWGSALIGLAQLKEADEADDLYRQAIEKYAKAVEIKKDDHEAYTNWALPLYELAELKEADEADKLYRQAIEKCAKAVEIKKNYHEAYNNWGLALIGLARNKTGEDRENLFKQAEAKLFEAESIKPGSGSYNLACIYALQDDEDKCRERLSKYEEMGTLITRKKAYGDNDLKSVRDKDWFKQIRWFGE